MPYSKILYSMKVDDICEKLFLSNFPDELIRELATMEEARNIFDAEIHELLSAIKEDSTLNMNVKKYAIDALASSLQKSDYILLKAIPIDSTILEKYFLSYIPIHSYIEALAALQIGFSIGINQGISVGLSTKKTWFDMVREVWKKSVKDVHPFQKGDTNQGTKHCMTIVKYLNRLRNRINVNLSDAVILLISAAVHDIGKSLVIKCEHEKVARDFIKTNYTDLNIEKGWEDSVCDVVEYHTGEVSLTNLPSSYSINVSDGGTGFTTLNVKIQRLAAIFRLCDVSDMSHTRISDIVFNLNEMKNLKSEDEVTYWKLFSRNNIDKLLLNSDHLDIIILPKVADPSHELDKIKESIRYDNDDLEDSDTSGILRAETIPSEFWVKGARP